MPGRLLDLLVPGSCPGCGRPGADEPCPACREDLSTPPERVLPRVPCPVPAWSCGAYRGARRRIVVTAKEAGSAAARRAMGAVLAAGVARLVADGALPPPGVLVPAPTRAAAARRRGGDPVLAACREAAARLPACRAARLLETRPGVADSADLGARGRRSNISGAVVPVRGWRPGPGEGPAVLVDDVLTTGATAAESVLVLASAGIRPAGVIVFASA
ncbi:ComF family protein [Corynebacterium sp.]|uniref:ComF family protein n=1 Tax=Corynebacterium sp. TaxID=1720 RepID=UPI0026DC44A8|nr:ComF family protein [Corynebacterium sp.]MDO4610208.1 ComF family protein [Corynebacterium sp.]